MRRFPRPLRACEAVLLGTLASNAARADNGPTVITGVFCDTEAQIASFAEAHLGAQLSVLEAIRAINKAAGKDACSPIANVIVGSMEEVKQMKLGGKDYSDGWRAFSRHAIEAGWPRP